MFRQINLISGKAQDFKHLPFTFHQHQNIYPLLFINIKTFTLYFSSTPKHLCRSIKLNDNKVKQRPSWRSYFILEYIIYSYVFSNI